MSHATQGGQAPDQASSGHQTGAAMPPGQIIPKARNAASHPTSHKQHGDTRLATAPDRPTRQVSQSPDEGPSGANGPPGGTYKAALVVIVETTRPRWASDSRLRNDAGKCASVRECSGMSLDVFWE
jgi:hypothetical protein